MDKNLAIGLLIVAVIVAVGYILVYMNPTVLPPGATTTVSVQESPAPSQNPSASQPSSPPPLQARAPKVETDQNATPSNSTVVVTGKVTPNGAPTSYWFEYGETTSLGSRTITHALGSGYIAIQAPAYITGFKANTTYHYRLSAQNRVATVNGTTYTFKTTNEPPPPRGSAPTTRTDSATAIDRTTANLNGHVNPNGSQTHYWFEYGLTSDLGNVTAIQSAGNGTASLSVSVSASDLRPQTKYFYRLNSQNQYGTVNGAIVSLTTKGPPSPGIPAVITDSATNIADNSARLRGRIDANGSETTYWFEYSEDSLLGSVLGTIETTPSQTIGGDTLTSVSADISGLDNDKRYFFRLVGRNEHGTVRGDSESFRTRK